MDKETCENVFKHKLTRREKVYFKLKELTKELLKNDTQNFNVIGIDANYIGEKIGVSRNNVSKELNVLFNEKKVVKIKGKPVLYLDRECLKNNLKFFPNAIVYDSTEEIRNLVKGNEKHFNGDGDFILKDEKTHEASALDNIIGAQDSLKNQIKQAKAAILYPPNGLHVLISGPTGVGKTTMAEIMYRFAVETKRLPQNAPFISFNCADYADNPQLLVSQLFGYTRGAFTGADKERKGLVGQASGGILFLDEVHRLPPQGQEMLFQLIDKGVYRRLGESESTKKVKVMLILATTENPKSAMLQTFLRRIPVFIKLPSLDERTPKERINFIYNFFREESKRVRLKINVSKEVLKALMVYKCQGNIGQLKVDIQLSCAKAFLDYLYLKKTQLDVRLSQLPEGVRNGFFSMNKKGNNIIQYFELNNKNNVIIDGTDDSSQKYDKEIFFIDQYNINEDFYDCISSAWKEILKQKLPDSERRKRIDSKTKEYFQKFFAEVTPKMTSMDDEAIIKIVDVEIYDAVKDTISEEFERYDKKIVYGLSLHINTLIERIKRGKIVKYPNQDKIFKEHPDEYKIAISIKTKLENLLHIKMPESEMAFLTMFLYTVKYDSNTKKVGVLVITHGDSAATTMADVANELIGENHAHAVNMPLNEKINDVFNKALLEVKKIDMGKGVLILVDMGSLAHFSDMITERTGILTRCIDMVSTPIVIEATRKSLMSNVNLEMLYEDVVSISPYVGRKRTNKEILFDYEAIKKCDSQYYRQLLVDAVDKILIFLDAKKVCNVLNETLDNILKDINKPIDNSLITKFIFHCSCMVERSIRKDTLPYKNLKSLITRQKNLFYIIKKNIRIVEETFSINIPDTEIAYVIEIFDTHYNML